ncbi:helix-turn-helix transcriptional regulator [Vallitalea sp.]|jgi:YesN/AraC family two-component response regulator|uniref:helix-turn-helix transcriptional regulator n=1 Tax=Vallitalea sp. TaxID=1882829 RepID=UPI0025E680CD|nr:AraC family transcriptional regulator [Vallitalea sp.]MCT4685904.1 AraC family transcriptional regulator [Vallitalea sp.]
MNSFMPEVVSAFYTQHKKHYSENHVFDERVTNTYELVCFLDDSNCKMLLDHKQYNIVGNSIVFRKPEQLNQSFMPYESILICFKWSWGKEEIKFVNSIPTVNKSLVQINYRGVFEEIYQESLLNRPYGRHYMSAKVMEILHGLYYERNNNIYHRQKMISHSGLIDMLHYIDDNLSYNFTIQTMSKALGISQRSIYQLFQEHIKMTPIQYINECRLNYAKKLLKHSNITIEQVSNMSGYVNVTYFITLFRKKEGMTPLKYRQKNLGTIS